MIIFNLGDPLSFLRTQPQFQQMRQVIQQNPQLLNAVLQQIGQSNPQLLQLISQNQESFVRMLNEPTATQGSNPSQGSGGGGAATGTGSAGSFPIESTITTQVSPQDREAIERVSIFYSYEFFSGTLLSIRYLTKCNLI